MAKNRGFADLIDEVIVSVDTRAINEVIITTKNGKFVIKTVPAIFGIEKIVLNKYDDGKGEM